VVPDDVPTFVSLVDKHVVHTQVNLSCSAEHRNRFDVPNIFGRGALQDMHLSDASVVLVAEHVFLRIEFIVEDTAFCKLMILLSPNTTLVRTMFLQKNQVFYFFFQSHVHNMITPPTAAMIKTPTKIDNPLDDLFVLCNIVESLAGSTVFCGSAGGDFFAFEVFAGRL